VEVAEAVSDWATVQSWCNKHSQLNFCAVEPKPVKWHPASKALMI